MSTIVPLPAVVQEDLAARRDVVANGLLGDGELTATLSRRGELEQLWWPHVDREPHLGLLRLAEVAGRGSRRDSRYLDDPEGEHGQRYDAGAAVLITEFAQPQEPVVTADLVVPARSVLLRQVSGLTGRLGVYVRPHLGGREQAGGAYVDTDGRVLVLHRRDHVLAVGIDAPAELAVGDRGRGDDLGEALLRDTLVDRGVAHGRVEGAVLADAPAGRVLVAIALADDRAAAADLVRTTLAEGWASALDARRREDAAQLERATPTLVHGGRVPPGSPEPDLDVAEVAALDERTQLVLRSVADRATGGVVAAPESDAEFVRSGGYGFVWARDLAFILFAQLASGRDDLAVPALRWLVRAQSPDGLWLQRHWTDGTLAPSWGTQLDETGAVLVAYDQAWDVLGDPELDAALWPSAQAAAVALEALLAPDTGLPAPSMDLWEERVGVHTYTAAAICAGFDAAARMALRHEPAEVERWQLAASRVRDGILAHLWSDEHGRFLRSLDVAREDDSGVSPVGHDRLEHPRPPVPSVDPVDATVDVSLLGLTYPFAVLPADDPRMAATIDAVERRLRTADGGVLRYEGDEYIGGNPWVLATLWLGLARRAPGASVLADGVGYAVASQTSTGLLPEQVDAATGGPAWIVPLTWSHAMYALAVRAGVRP